MNNQSTESNANSTSNIVHGNLHFLFSSMYFVISFKAYSYYPWSSNYDSHLEISDSILD